MRYVFRWIVVLCCAVATLPPAKAERRVALLIGNGSYAHIPHLPNVANDAAAMAALFKAANFDTVDVQHNLGIAALRGALRKFAGNVADADVAVLFYAGHGIEVGQVNYLIPVDARLLTDYDVEDEAVSLDRVLQAMDPAKRLRLVILDACRENPFIKSIKPTVAVRSVGRGLGRVEPPTTNTLIAFATKPNAVAQDGKGRNSPFTAALIKHLMTPGLDVRLALGHVRDEVLASTASKQEPYVTGSLGGGVVSLSDSFVAANNKTIITPAPVPLTAADRIWVAVKDGTSIAALEAFRREYGPANPVYDRLAEARINELKNQQLARLKIEQDRKRAEEDRIRADAVERFRQEEIRLSVEAAKKRADEEERARREAREADAERQRLMTIKLENEKKHAEIVSANQMEASKKLDAVQKTKGEADERQRVAALRKGSDQKAGQPIKSVEREKRKIDLRDVGANCERLAKLRGRAAPGWGAIAIGAAGCGFSYGASRQNVAELRALSSCRRKTTGCRIVKLIQ